MTNHNAGAHVAAADEELLGLKKEAITEKLMKEGENCVTVFPVQIMCIATVEQLATSPAPPTTTHKRAWEQMSLMAKLLQVKAKREGGLKEDLVNGVIEIVDEKLEGQME